MKVGREKFHPADPILDQQVGIIMLTGIRSYYFWEEMMKELYIKSNT